eukprot:scaffold200_cov173-Amphora_coffeaeformis.AAC.2
MPKKTCGGRSGGSKENVNVSMVEHGGPRTEVDPVTSTWDVKLYGTWKSFKSKKKRVKRETQRSSSVSNLSSRSTTTFKIIAVSSPCGSFWGIETEKGEIKGSILKLWKQFGYGVPYLSKMTIMIFALSPFLALPLSLQQLGFGFSQFPPSGGQFPEGMLKQHFLNPPQARHETSDTIHRQGRDTIVLMNISHGIGHGFGSGRKWLKDGRGCHGITLNPTMLQGR